MPGAQTHLIAGAGHSPNVENRARAAPRDGRVGAPVCTSARKTGRLFCARRHGAWFTESQRSCSEGTSPNSASGVCGATGGSSAATCLKPRLPAHFGYPCNPSCKIPCRPKRPSTLYELMFDSKTKLTAPADRRRRPADRLRHARRVRPRARWENVSELRNPPPHRSSARTSLRRREADRPFVLRPAEQVRRRQGPHSELHPATARSTAAACRAGAEPT